MTTISGTGYSPVSQGYTDAAKLAADPVARIRAQTSGLQKLRYPPSYQDVGETPVSRGPPSERLGGTLPNNRSGSVPGLIDGRRVLKIDNQAVTGSTAESTGKIYELTSRGNLKVGRLAESGGGTIDGVVGGIIPAKTEGLGGVIYNFKRGFLTVMGIGEPIKTVNNVA